MVELCERGEGKSLKSEGGRIQAGLYSREEECTGRTESMRAHWRTLAHIGIGQIRPPYGIMHTSDQQPTGNLNPNWRPADHGQASHRQARQATDRPSSQAAEDCHYGFQDSRFLIQSIAPAPVLRKRAVNGASAGPALRGAHLVFSLFR